MTGRLGRGCSAARATNAAGLRSLAVAPEGPSLDRWRRELWSTRALLGRTRACRTEPERREGPLLADLNLTLSRQLERGRKGGRPRAATHLGIGARLEQKIVEILPIGHSAEETGQGLARLGERPDIARSETDARQRVSLSLPGISRQEVIKAGLIRGAA